MLPLDFPEMAKLHGPADELRCVWKLSEVKPSETRESVHKITILPVIGYGSASDSGNTPFLLMR